MEDEIAGLLQSQYAVDEAYEARLFDSLPFDDSTPDLTETSVGVAEIKSLVCRGKGSIPGTNYLVPSFAVHWALVIRHSIFHLRYFPNQEKRVRFVWGTWQEDMKKDGHEIQVVGTTHYNTDQLVEIGNIFWLEFANRFRPGACGGFRRLPPVVLELPDICQNIFEEDM